MKPHKLASFLHSRGLAGQGEDGSLPPQFAFSLLQSTKTTVRVFLPTDRCFVFCVRKSPRERESCISKEAASKETKKRLTL